MQKQITSIKDQLLQNPRIQAAATSYNVMGMGAGGPVMWAEGDGVMNPKMIKLKAGDRFPENSNHNRKWTYKRKP